MDDFKGFIQDYIQGRVVDLINELSATTYKDELKTIEVLKSKLYLSLTTEQREMLDDYCTAYNHHTANLLDEIYKQAFSDGMTLNEILKGECNND